MIRFLLTICFSLLSFGFFVIAQSASNSMKGAKVIRQKELDRKGDSAVVYYGVASYYADKFVGRKTANGEIFSQEKMTCAHNTLKLGTWIKVTNLRNKRWVIVRVNDRLNYKNTRIVDLSRAAAAKLGYVGRGLTRVKVEVLEIN